MISTPYWYAEELLADGRGVLVKFRDPGSIAEAVLALQASPETRNEMGRLAAQFGKQMLWPEVGRCYLASFARAKRENAERLKSLVRPPTMKSPFENSLPILNLKHLKDLSDDTGIIQHATFTVPNRSEGYCVDDNARALLFTAQMETNGPLSNDLSLLQSRYLSFVLYAFNGKNGRFRNFMGYDRTWLEEAGSDDSHGRSVWSLGAMVHRCQDQSRRDIAKVLFETSAPALYKTTSLRTWAYAVLGTEEYLQAFPHEYSVQVLRHTMANRIWQQFEVSASEDWPWFEEGATYGNARISQALLLAGEAIVNHQFLDAGLKSLAWLMNLQSTPSGLFAPIGTNGFYRRGSELSRFDQQPIEAASAVSACISAYKVTADPIWLEEAHRAFRWFLGANSLGLPVYDPMSGGCHDGLHPDRVNRNEGAESTLSFICALNDIRVAMDASGPNQVSLQKRILL